MVRNSETQWAEQLDIYIESHMTVTRCFVGSNFYSEVDNKFRDCCCDIILEPSFLLNVELLLTRVGLGLDLNFE